MSVGGTDAGPTPYDLLLAALGSCTAMTLRMYADRKGLPLQRATVSLRHDRIHAKDCEQCDRSVGMLSRIRREIDLEGPLGDQDRRRLVEIADRCPVHRTHRGPVGTTGGCAPTIARRARLDTAIGEMAAASAFAPPVPLWADCAGSRRR